MANSKESFGKETFHVKLSITYEKTSGTDYYGNRLDDAVYEELVDVAFKASNLPDLSQMIDKAVGMTAMSRVWPPVKE